MRKTYEQKSQTAFYNEIYKAKLSAVFSVKHTPNDPRIVVINKMFKDLEDYIRQIVAEEEQQAEIA
jgi:hypothetical protein